MAGIEELNALPGRKDALILKLENRLRGHDMMVILAIAAISILFRVSYYVELHDSPLAYFHRVGITDMRVFHDWGKYIADGDLLLDREFHPDVDWYRRMAERYFKEHPDELDKLKKGARADGKKDFDPQKALWNKWLGGKAFHQEPLYGYIIGLFYKLFGPDPGNIFIFQMVLGVATNILIYLITARCFGLAAGVFAASLAVFCGPLLFHEMILLRTTITLFWCVMLVYAAQRFFDGWRVPAGLTLGILAGLAILTQVYFIVFLAGVVVLSFFHSGGLTRLFLKKAAIVTSGCALVLSLIAARNMAVGISAFTLFGNGALAMIGSNSKGGDLWTPTFSGETFRDIMYKTEGKFIPALIETLKTHDSVWSLAALFANKVAVLLDWYEIPAYSINFYYYQSHSFALLLAPVTFLAALPLGLAGIVISLKDWRRVAPHFLMVGTVLAPLLVYMTVGRYRAPLLISLIPFAGYGLAKISSDRRAAATAAVTLFVMSSYFVILPVRNMIRLSDYQCSGEAYFYPKIRDAEKRGAFGEVVGIYEEWFRFEHGFGTDKPPVTQEQANIRASFAALLIEYAVALRKSGRDKDAESHERQADILLASVGLRKVK